MIFNLLKNTRIYKNRKSDQQPDKFTAIEAYSAVTLRLDFPNGGGLEQHAQSGIEIQRMRGCSFDASLNLLIFHIKK